MKPEGSSPYSQHPATIPMPSQINPIHAFPFCFFKIHINVFKHNQQDATLQNGI
jgi:hypothetical protein